MKFCCFDKQLNLEAAFGFVLPPLEVVPDTLVLHESATVYKHVDTKINVGCFEESCFLQV